MKPQAPETALAIAVGLELASNILQAVVGNDLADTLAGSALTRDLAYQNTLTDMQSELAPKLGN